MSSEDEKMKEFAQRIAKIDADGDELCREMIVAITKFRRNQILFAETMSEIVKGKDEDPGMCKMKARFRNASFWLGKIAHAKDAADAATAAMEAAFPVMADKGPAEAKSIFMCVQDQAILHEVYKAVWHADKDNDLPPVLAAIVETHEETPAVPQ